MHLIEQSILIYNIWFLKSKCMHMSRIWILNYFQKKRDMYWFTHYFEINFSFSSREIYAEHFELLRIKIRLKMLFLDQFLKMCRAHVPFFALFCTLFSKKNGSPGFKWIKCSTIHHHHSSSEDRSGGFFFSDTTKCLFHADFFTAIFHI